MKTMNELFLHVLQDRHDAEQAQTKSATKIMNAGQNGDAEPAERLARVFEAVGKCPRGFGTPEVTRFGALAAFARQMGFESAIAELAALRDAARADDGRLTEIAEADESSDDEEDDEDEDEEDDEDDDEEEDEELDDEEPTKEAKR